MNRRRFEAEALVETTHPLVLGTDKDRANAGNIGGLKRTQNRISQQTPAYLFPLMMKIDSQPGQDHHRNLMPRQPPSDALSRGNLIHGPHGQAIIADDPAPLTNNKGPRRIGLLVLHCMAPQPIVQQSMATIEIATIMLFRKQNGDLIGHR